MGFKSRIFLNYTLRHVHSYKLYCFRTEPSPPKKSKIEKKSTATTSAAKKKSSKKSKRAESEEESEEEETKPVMKSVIRKGKIKILIDKKYSQGIIKGKTMKYCTNYSYIPNKKHDGLGFSKKMAISLTLC